MSQLKLEHTHWLTDLNLQDPEMLDYRERFLSTSGGISFSQLLKTQTVSNSSLLNDEIILDLIHQHLVALGFNKTVKSLENEHSQVYQFGERNFECTDLRFLVSLAIGPRESAFSVSPDLSHHFIPKRIDHDLRSNHPKLSEKFSTNWSKVIPDLEPSTIRQLLFQFVFVNVDPNFEIYAHSLFDKNISLYSLDPEIQKHIQQHLTKTSFTSVFYFFSKEYSSSFYSN